MLSIQRIRNQIYNILRYAREFGPRAAFSIAVAKLSGREPVALRLKGIPTDVWCRPNHGDLFVLAEVFAHEVYRHEPTVEPKLIIDAGGNVGYAAVYFANRFPGAVIVSVEMDKANAVLFEKNTQDYRNIRLIPKAVWPEVDTVEILNASGASHSFRVGTGTKTENSIETITIPLILQELEAERINLLKIDIEGGEKMLFSKATESWLHKVDVLMMEIHDQYEPGCTDAVLAALSNRPYQRKHAKGVDIFCFTPQ